MCSNDHTVIIFLAVSCMSEYRYPEDIFVSFLPIDCMLLGIFGHLFQWQSVSIKE